MEAKDFRGYATKAATPTMEAFADFLIAEVYGGTLPDGLDEATFRKGVALGGSLRMPFQASETWKKDPRNYLANVDARRAEKAAEALRKAEAAKAKVAARIAKAEAALADAKAKAEAALAESAEAASEAGEAATDAPEAAPEAATKRGRRAA